MLQEYNPKNENIFIHVNGELLPRKEAKVSVFDSIVQNGDGVWEGLRVYPEGIVCYDKHLTRLQEGAHALGYEGVPTKEEIKKALIMCLNPKRPASLRKKVCACITNFTASITAPVPLTDQEEQYLSEEAEKNGLDEEQIMEMLTLLV